MIFSLMQSTFISYGTPDEAFAKKLNDALKRQGVVTFYFPHDAVPGKTLRETMHRGVNEHDRVILVCSTNSLGRSGLLNELEETLRRESRDGGASYLIPIMLDDAVLTWMPAGRDDIAESVRDRVMADFRGWEGEEGIFPQEVAKPRVRGISALRHLGVGLSSPGLPQLRPLAARRAELQAQRLLPLVRGPPHGRHGRAP